MYLDALHHFVIRREKFSGVSITSETARFVLLVAANYIHADSAMTKSVTTPWTGTFFGNGSFELPFTIPKKSFLHVKFLLHLQEGYFRDDVHEVLRNSAGWTSVCNTILQWTLNGKVLL